MKESISNNSLYNLKSKTKLEALLFLNSKEFSSNYNIYCINDKKRLVEQPLDETDIVQKRIFKFLQDIKAPKYLFSGVKGKSHIDNAIYHKDQDYIMTLDISKFYPKCSEKYIYIFFKYKMKMSTTNAKILANICTIDIENYDLSKTVLEWYLKANKNLKSPIPSKHLPTGSSLSQILSFLSYYDMFDEIYIYCKRNNLKFSLFVDDITISSKKEIKRYHAKNINHILSKYGHESNLSKIKYFPKNYPKKITGIWISTDKKIKTPSKIHQSIIMDLNKILNESNSSVKESLIGRIGYVNLVENDKFRNLKYKILKNKLDK